MKGLLYTATLSMAEIVFLFAAKIERPKIYVSILGLHHNSNFN